MRKARARAPKGISHREARRRAGKLNVIGSYIEDHLAGGVG
jgi:hypothetical protein